MSNASYFKEEILWARTVLGEFPYKNEHETGTLMIRINDFPEENLYTLICNDKEVKHFDEWPKLWNKPVGCKK